MSYRLFLPNFGRNKLFPFLKVVKKRSMMRNLSSSAKKPSVPFFDSPSIIFSMEALRHHWGAWPVVITFILGLSCEVFGMMYLGATRSDVWMTKGPAQCEIVETRKGYKPKVMKIKVINQKYETPPGLLEAVTGLSDNPPEEPPKEAKKK